MQSLGLVTRINVLTAIRDHDQLGSVEFRSALSFDVPSEEVLVERGKRYDARAVLAYAYGKATGDFPSQDQVSFGSLKVLTDLGFSVMTLGDSQRPKAPAKRPRTASSSTPRATPVSRTKPEPVVRLCPSCFTQLSVTGTCNFCE